MKFSEVLVLLAAGTLGGIFSTVVSIASLVTYPVLLALGVPALSANMTNTVSLVLTGAGSVAGSRPELTGERGRVLRLGVITALGGAAGAAVYPDRRLGRRPYQLYHKVRTGKRYISRTLPGKDPLTQIPPEKSSYSASTLPTV